MPKINEISKGVKERTSEEIRALAVAAWAKGFPLSSHAQFYPIVGNADKPRRKDGVLSGGASRDLGADYAAAKSNTPSFADVSLKVYGDKVHTDIAYERRGFDIGSQRARDLENLCLSLGRDFMDAFINDESTLAEPPGAPSGLIAGLKEQTTVLNRNFRYAYADGYVPSGSTAAEVESQRRFREELEALILDIDGGPDVLVMNSNMIARLKSIGFNNVSTTSVPDVYGVQHEVTSYLGIPIVNAGYKNDNSGLVIPNNELVGPLGEIGTSIYLVKFGDQQDVCLPTNSGIDVKDNGVVGTQYETVVEFDVDLAVLNTKAIARMSGIVLTAPAPPIG